MSRPAARAASQLCHCSDHRESTLCTVAFPRPTLCTDACGARYLTSLLIASSAGVQGLLVTQRCTHRHDRQDRRTAGRRLLPCCHAASCARSSLIFPSPPPR
ncbi:hypothetical protein CC85DRAFT_56299 [Cutaneotrichosporon oleaginosum]|uniref:Uncharacterized protein n=1 Tax=Cutaneotrichosporon oleaginosum TaxID=879819 RepID=A0A0J0XYN1_9TREE|nr:uncharacterized protein CC85DRAFT_56299 [Cutaneotrichosporon oleaginosum]KLT46160.1 hypothetical protein CC85DRAFT_56299 [Cutaneotrichosporon oleaginosum]TXT10169.1 hypothetical protein COLE_04103 [Cutaneotrichosporon oleaginosum]